EFAADQCEGVAPGDRFITICGGAVRHWFREPTLVLDREIAPAHQLGDGAVGEEITSDALAGHLPGNVLDAVLADVHTQALAVVGPRAAGAVEAAILVVHAEDRAHAIDDLALPQEGQPDAPGCSPGRRRVVVVMLGESAVR